MQYSYKNVANEFSKKVGEKAQRKLKAPGLLAGMVQAYISSILATVCIAAAAHDSKTLNKKLLTTKN